MEAKSRILIMIFGMIELARLADLCQRLRASPGRLQKLALLADYLRALPSDAVATAVAFLTGRAFPQSDPRVLGVRWLPPVVRDGGGGGPLTLADVAAAFAEIAEAGGAGARRLRDERLRALAARASMTSARRSRGSSAARCAPACPTGSCSRRSRGRSGADVERRAPRRALPRRPLGGGRRWRARGGAAALTAARRRGSSCRSCRCSRRSPTDFDEVLAAHGGRDRARVQVRRRARPAPPRRRRASAIWTRRLSDVTASLPDVVALVRRDAARRAVHPRRRGRRARRRPGRPLPFQELMRRFRRVHGVEALAARCRWPFTSSTASWPTAARSIDEPYAARWEALTRVTGGRHLAERAIVRTAEAARDAFTPARSRPATRA